LSTLNFLLSFFYDLIAVMLHGLMPHPLLALVEGLRAGNFAVNAVALGPSAFADALILGPSDRAGGPLGLSLGWG
jgi:hypothetical protein